jgi:3-phenylpropionate/trans-cinnamate dioxygenase ferredoxin reductase component
VSGAELEGIHYLRTLGNTDTIRADASGKKVVMIGGSYIACEVAASLTELGSSCSLVMLESVPLSRHFGEQAGRFFENRMAEHGIETFGDNELDRFEGTGGRVTRVITKSGRQLDADAVVIGIGAVPDVRLARTAGLEIGDGGGVVVDSRLQTAVPGIFAAGDIAEYESVVHGGQRIRIEHWDVAFNHGKTAALNMLGRDQPHDVVPYFFSDLSDWASLEYIGPAQEWDQEVIRGSLDDGEFAIFYLEDGRVKAALSVGRSDDLDHARRLLVSGTDVRDRVAELADVSSDLASI